MIRKLLLYTLLFSLAAPALAYELKGKTEREVKADIRLMMSDSRYQEVVDLCDQIKQEQFDLKEADYYHYLAERRIKEQKEGKRPQKKTTIRQKKPTTTKPDKKEPEKTETQTQATQQPDKLTESTQATQKTEQQTDDTDAVGGGNLTNYLMFAFGGLLVLVAGGGVVLLLLKSKKSAPAPQAPLKKIEETKPFAQVEPTVPIIETPVAEAPKDGDIHFEKTMVIPNLQPKETAEQEQVAEQAEPTESFILSDEAGEDDEDEVIDPMTAIGKRDVVETLPLEVDEVDEGTLSEANTEIVMDLGEESPVIEIDMNAEPGPLSLSLDDEKPEPAETPEEENPQPESIKLFDTDQDISFGAMDEKTRPPGPQEMPSSGLQDSDSSPQPKSISEMKGSEISLNDTSVFHAAETAALNLHPAGASDDSDDDDEMERTVVRSNMRQEALFQEQYRQGVDAFEKEDWKTAVHFLSIAIALNGDNEDAKEKLKSAREHRKEHADS